MTLFSDYTCHAIRVGFTEFILERATHNQENAVPVIIISGYVRRNGSPEILFQDGISAKNKSGKKLMQ